MDRVIQAPCDLPASDARYHKDYLSRFFSHRGAPGQHPYGDDQTENPQSESLQKLITELRANRNKIWDSVELQERFTDIAGYTIKRSDLLEMLSRNVHDLVTLSANGYRKIVMFQDNAIATLKVTKDEYEEDGIDAVLGVVVKPSGPN